MTLKPGAWCLRCGARDTEPAAEGCKNPSWHIPNANAPREPVTAPEPEVRLPYAEN